MLKKNAVCLLVSAFVMIAMPWLVLSVVHGDFGMGLCFLLFYGLNPLTAILVGGYSGINLKYMFFQPILPPVLFLVGVRLFFTLSDKTFWILAAVYLALGIIAMVIMSFAAKRKGR